VILTAPIVGKVVTGTMARQRIAALASFLLDHAHAVRFAAPLSCASSTFLTHQAAVARVDGRQRCFE
jgi:hypothetical protein